MTTNNFNSEFTPVQLATQTSSGGFIIHDTRSNASQMEEQALATKVASLASENELLSGHLANSRLEIAQAKAEALLHKRDGTDVTAVLKELHEHRHRKDSEVKFSLNVEALAERDAKRRRLGEIEDQLQHKEVDEAINDALKMLHQHEVTLQHEVISNEKELSASLEKELAEANSQVAAVMAKLNAVQEEATQKGEATARQKTELAVLQARLTGRSKEEAFMTSQREEAARNANILREKIASLEPLLQERSRKVSELDGQVDKLQVSVGRAQAAHAELERQAKQLRHEEDTLKAQIARLTKESGEKSELLSIRSTELDAKNAEHSKLLTEARTLKTELEDSNKEKAEKERWEWHAYADASGRSEVIKNLNAEVARLRGELDHVQAALGERELVVQHHQQRVAEATAQSREFREMAARKREELNAQAQQFEEVTINLRMMNATLAGKTLEVQRLVGVVATLSAREREGAEEVDQLQMTLHRLQEELSALHSAPKGAPVDVAKAAQLEFMIQEHMTKINTQKSEYEALIIKNRAMVEEARVERIGEYEEKLRRSREHLLALEAEIRSLRDEPSHYIESSDGNCATLIEEVRVQRESNALLAAQLQANEEQLANKDEELLRARSAHKTSDARLGSLAAEVSCMSHPKESVGGTEGGTRRISGSHSFAGDGGQHTRTSGFHSSVQVVRRVSLSSVTSTERRISEGSAHSH